LQLILLFLIGFCLEKGRWYAKRFMHPDIVEQYNYIFLWDEDLGVKNFNASRYCVYRCSCNQNPTTLYGSLEVTGFFSSLVLMIFFPQVKFKRQHKMVHT
jgi:hypothetical protein